MTGPGALPPAGWYVDPAGHTRWWTGTTWGAYAPAPTGPMAPAGYPPARRADANSLAMLAQLGQVVGGFLLPLILYLTAGRDDAFVRHHSAESLNMSITYFVAVCCLFPLFFVGIIVWPLLILVVPAFIALVVTHLIFAITAIVKAYRGEWYRYPICIRLVSGAVEPTPGR
jgi:uncharacterized protein